MLILSDRSVVIRSNAQPQQITSHLHVSRGTSDDTCALLGSGASCIRPAKALLFHLSNMIPSDSFLQRYQLCASRGWGCRSSLLLILEHTSNEVITCQPLNDNFWNRRVVLWKKKTGGWKKSRAIFEECSVLEGWAVEWSLLISCFYL